MSATGGTAAQGEGPGPGHRAALAARNALEEALFELPNVPLELDRAGLRDRLLRGIECLYAVLDSPVVAAVHLDGLTEGAAIAGEARALLAAAGDGAKVEPLGRALARLAAAEQGLRAAAEAVAQIQLARRAELVGGRLGDPPPAARPFRASVGLPELHAFPRRPLLPHVAVEPAVDLAAPQAPPVQTPRPEDLAALAAFAADASSGALEERHAGEDLDEPATVAPAPLPFAYEPAVEEAEVLRRLGRDCLEDIANHRTLRKPNAMESWLDQEPFEQRLLANVDAFAALGGAVLPLVSLYNAEAKIPDPERAFAVALTLGCIEGSDAVGAAVMTLKQSAPETFPGWVEGFWLAPSPAIDPAMADLSRSPRADLAALALDVLHARGSTPEDVVAELLDRPEPAIAARVARALASALPRDQAVPALERLAARAADPGLFAAAVESLLRRRHGEAWALLRRAVAAPASPEHASRAMRLLCLAGRASDVDAVVEALRARPSAPLARMAGRYGHPGVLPALVALLGGEDPEVVAGAAEALERITGAGLRETVEVPWPIELPEGAEAAGALPVPTHPVNQVIADPARWQAWLDEHARKLPAGAKVRGGVGFTPMQIVEELDAKATPPDRRAEAALELAVVTGIQSAFSAEDWVARQRSHLAELRARVLSLGAAAGVWTLGGAAVADDPARARPRGTRPDGPAPPPLQGPPLPSIEPSAANAPQLPSFMVARRASSPGFEAVRPGDGPAMASGSSSPPPGASPPGMTARPAEEPSLDSTVIGISPFAAKGVALPFARTPAPAGVAPPASARAAHPTPPQSLGETTASAAPSPLASVLPFADRTDLPAPSPLAAALPFAPRPGPTAPPETAPARVAAAGSALPFRQGAGSGTHPAVQPPAGPPSAAAPPPDLTLEQYALLCVELWREPARTLEIRARYHLQDGRAWSAFNWLWQDWLARDPALKARWTQLTARFQGMRNPR